MELKSINPFTQKVLETFIPFSKNQIDDCLEKSAKAFAAYRSTIFEDRSVMLLRLAQILRRKTDYYARTITLEMGKPIRESVAEISKCAWVCEYYAENGSHFLSIDEIPTDAYDSHVKYEPLGPILAVMPWNYPFWQVFRCAIPALMAGNSMLLKHASNVQRCALQIEEVFREAGFPDGIFQTLVIGSDNVAYVIESDVVRAVTLTGSEAAGSAVAELSGRKIKKTVLELGGSNAFIVLEDADLDKAAATGLQARMQNAGQSCIAAKRFILQRSIADDFIGLFLEKMARLKVGDPLDPSTEMGPLANIVQADQLQSQLERSLSMGANIRAGGKHEGAFFYPTVLDSITPEMPVFAEETFGPIAPMIIADSDAEAIRLANLSKYGLGASIFTTDLERASKLSDEIQDGSVFVNTMVKSDPRLPFGGTKQSGYGRELSLHGIREFVNVKTFYIQP